jgi:hypothetical protein
LIKSGRNNLLCEIIWIKFSGSIRLLIEPLEKTHLALTVLAQHVKKDRGKQTLPVTTSSVNDKSGRI